MIATAYIQIALLSTSATIALVLAIAWHEFGRPRHALTWSFGFALLALVWAVKLVPHHYPDSADLCAALTYGLTGLAAALNTLGFRQRAGGGARPMPLLLAALGNAALILMLGVAHAPEVVRLIPVNLFNTAMFYLAARTLRGRRKGERAAERVAETGLLLLALLSVAVLIGLVAAVAGLVRLDVEQLGMVTLLMLPGIIAGIGLFTIILLAADLADQARRLAATDMLTGLLNRRGFEESADALIRSARQHDRAMTLVLMDVDRFKRVNDLFGHPTGDQVLRDICKTLCAGVGRRDIVARFGGEEFALILVDTDIAGASALVEALRHNIADLALDLPEPHRVTASFGVAALLPQDDGIAPILRRADEALYRSKADGRNRVTLG